MYLIFSSIDLYFFCQIADDDNEDDSSEEENSEGRRQLSTLVNETPYEDETHGDKREPNMEVNQVRQKKQSRKRKPSMKGIVVDNWNKIESSW